VGDIIEIPTLNLEVTRSGTHADFLIPEVQLTASHKKE